MLPKMLYVQKNKSPKKTKQKNNNDTSVGRSTCCQHKNMKHAKARSLTSNRNQARRAKENPTDGLKCAAREREKGSAKSTGSATAPISTPLPVVPTPITASIASSSTLGGWGGRARALEVASGAEADRRRLRFISAKTVSTYALCPSFGGERGPRDCR